MIESLHDAFVESVRALGGWSYLLLAVLVILEGPVATLLGAAAASSGALSPALVFVAAACGNLTGDLCWYALGRYAPTRWLRRRAAPLLESVRENAPKVIFTAKLTWTLAVTVLVSLGLARVPVRRWLPADAAAEVIWTGALVLAGVHAFRYIPSVALVGWVLLAIALLVWQWRRRRCAC